MKDAANSGLDRIALLPVVKAQRFIYHSRASDSSATRARTSRQRSGVKLRFMGQVTPDNLHGAPAVPAGEMDIGLLDASLSLLRAQRISRRPKLPAKAPLIGHGVGGGFHRDILLKRRSIGGIGQLRSATEGALKKMTRGTADE